MVRSGTITLVDITDIDTIENWYLATDQSSGVTTSTVGWTTTVQTMDSSHPYLWNYEVIKGSGSVVINTTDPVIIGRFGTDGEPGEPGQPGQPGQPGAQGVSVLRTEIEYYKKTSDGLAPTSETTGSSTIPEYEEGCTYYKRSVTYLDNNTTVNGDWFEDAALTSEVANAYNAWVAAGAAEQRTRKIINNENGVTVIGGITGIPISESDLSTFGYNTIMAPNYLGLRYNAINLSKLTTTGLEFYIPTVNSGGQPIQGTKGIEITSNAITFYNPNSISHETQLIIGNNGTLQSGNYSRGEDSKFASAGTRIDLTNGDIITQYFRVSQGLEPGINAGAYIHGVIEAISGKIGAGSTNYWEIGEYTDYNLATNATMVGHGGSFIQLGDNLTWRLATNRLHTGWYSDNSTTLTYPIIDSKYWDFGVHAPTAKADKFLYIRNSKDETTSTGVLERLLYDIDDTYTSSQWDYKFYIDGEGNLVTTGTIDAHNISIDGQSIAGGSLIAGSLAAYGGTSTKPVYFPSSGDNQGKPVAVDWDVNNTIEDTITNNGNIATIGALKAYIEGKNYSTTTGTVTSIGLTEGPGIEITGGPVTSSGTITVGHSNSITAGTAGTSSATSGSTLSVPYVAYDSEGHVTAAGVHTHTITGFFVDGNLDANETVITDSTGSLTSRKVVEGYTIIQTLPTVDIDTNMIYLVPTEYDVAGSGGEGGATKYNQYIYKNGEWCLVGFGADTVTYTLVRNGNDIILQDNNGDSAGTVAALASLPIANSSTLGGIIVGSGLSVNSTGTLSVNNSSISITKSQITDLPTLGSAAEANITTSITSGGTGIPTAGTVYDYVGSAIAASDAMVFKGTIGTEGTETDLPTSNVHIGDTYRVITAGTYANQKCEVGDLIIAMTTTPTWTVAQTNIDGAITSLTNGTNITITGSGSSRTISHSTYTAANAAAVKIGRDGTGHVVIGSALSKSDVGLGNVLNEVQVTGIGQGDDGKIRVYKGSSSYEDITVEIVATESTTAESADKLTSYGGSATQPVYFPSTGTNAGKPVATTYALNKTVPADAVFMYTFENGTNGFKVTPSGGTAQTVTVTPSIANNVTGSGTSGSLVKWNGTNTITNGPALGSDTTKFLNNKGEWAVPGGTFSLSIANYNTLGGVKPWFSTTGASTLKSGNAATYTNNPSVNARTTTADRYYAVETDTNGRLFVNVPWVDTDNNTLNTAGSTDTSSKIFLIGATSQTDNSQTYSHDTAYVGTNGHLYSASKEVLVGGSNSSSSVTITPSTTSVYSMTSAGSVTAGTAAKFTPGTFTAGSFTMAPESTTATVTALVVSFTAPSHTADSFTANTPTAVTLPGRSSEIKAWTGYTAATAAAQTFTGKTS